MRTQGTRESDTDGTVFERKGTQYRRGAYSHKREGEEETFYHERQSDRFQAAPRTWTEIVAISTLAIMAIGLISFALHLEDTNKLQDKTIEDFKAQISKGILPVTEERITVLSQRVLDLNRQLERIENLYIRPQQQQEHK